MAQEVVRRDELATSFDVFKTWVQAAAAVPLTLTIYPAVASVVERIECTMQIGIVDAVGAGGPANLGIPVTNIVSPMGLYWNEGGTLVGMCGSPNVLSYGDTDTYMAAQGKDMNLITHLRTPTLIQGGMTLGIAVAPTTTGQAPTFLSIAAGATACTVRLVARFTFFGPRDTRLF